MAGVRLFGTMGAEASFREEDFFGREEELSALTRAAVEGGRGIGSSFMIYGPPNIGTIINRLQPAPTATAELIPNSVINVMTTRP